MNTLIKNVYVYDSFKPRIMEIVKRMHYIQGKNGVSVPKKSPCIFTFYYTRVYSVY